MISKEAVKGIFTCDNAKDCRQDFFSVRSEVIRANMINGEVSIH